MAYGLEDMIGAQAVEAYEGYDLTGKKIEGELFDGGKRTQMLFMGIGQFAGTAAGIMGVYSAAADLPFALGGAAGLSEAEAALLGELGEVDQNVMRGLLEEAGQAGTAEAPVPPATQLRNAQGQFQSGGGANVGRPFEERVTSWAESTLDDVTEQVSIRPTLDDGTPADYGVRMDTMGRDRITGDIRLLDAKSSATAGLQKNQRTGYPLIERNGGVVYGQGGGALYPEGTPIPPTRVQIIRPADLPPEF